jgi:hypothetical protein
MDKGVFEQEETSLSPIAFGWDAISFQPNVLR